MQPIAKSLCSGSIADKILHGLQFIVTTALETSGIVEDVTLVFREYNFILDVVLTTLCPMLHVSDNQDEVGRTSEEGSSRI